MAKTILGARIRERRRQMGVAQAELARQIGISPSYLNLIERNKRPIAGPLLRRTAEALTLSLEELDGAGERRLHDTLEELGSSKALERFSVEINQVGELIGRYPGWASAIAAVADAERNAQGKARAMMDRLAHDPFLGETVHKMLTRIASIRSAAEILTSFQDIEPAERANFDAIIASEAHDLSTVGEALASYFDRAAAEEAALTPLDEVEAFFDAREHWVDLLESAAAALAPQIDTGAPLSRREQSAALAREHLDGVISAIAAAHPKLETEAARVRAERLLRWYATAAILLPMHAFQERAAELSYDIEALAEAFAVGPEVIFRRLTALPLDDNRPRFGYFRANASGAIIESIKLRDLNPPRYAAACPLWVLFRAQQSPEAVIRQRVAFPNGGRFVFLARARHFGETGFGKPRHYLTDMAALTEQDAKLTVYAPDASAPVDEVGPTCRLCARPDCAHRVDDPIFD